MPDTTYDLDIAISFVNEDLGFATELRDGLGESFEVFIYTKKQEELAGTDGLQSFRDAFRVRARLVVILLRERWGKTPWTRVEQEAITDRFLKEGPDFLFVIMMDESAPPPWLPEKLIRFSLKDFGVIQAIGAIKARALEKGSKIVRPNAAFLAQRSQERAKFSQQRATLLSSEAGVRAAQAEARALVLLLRERASAALAAAPELEAKVGATAEAFGIKTPGVALVCSYHNNYVNVLEHASLVVREIRGGILLPGEQGHYWRAPMELGVRELVPEFSPELGWCWKTKKGELLSSDQVVTQCIEQFFDLLDRQSARKLPAIEW